MTHIAIRSGGGSSGYSGYSGEGVSLAGLPDGSIPQAVSGALVDSGVSVNTDDPDNKYLSTGSLSLQTPSLGANTASVSELVVQNITNGFSPVNFEKMVSFTPISTPLNPFHTIPVGTLYLNSADNKYYKNIATDGSSNWQE